MLAELREPAHDQQALRRRSCIHFFMLQYPGISVRDENRMQTRGQRGLMSDFGLLPTIQEESCASSYFSMIAW